MPASTKPNYELVIKKAKIDTINCQDCGKQIEKNETYYIVRNTREAIYSTKEVCKSCARNYV